MKKIIGNVIFAIICVWLVYATASYIDILQKVATYPHGMLLKF